MKLGDSFYFSDRSIDPHCWLVLSDPTKHGFVIIVNCSTKDGGKTGLPVIQPGEHRPPLTQLSYVRWDRMRVIKSTALPDGVKSGLISKSQPLSDGVLRRLQTEMLASPLPPREAKAVLRITLEAQDSATQASRPSRAPEARPPAF